MEHDDNSKYLPRFPVEENKPDPNQFFLGHYIKWRQNRVKKIIAIFGEEYFKGKTILELGCGYGLLGSHFTKLGAIVTFADGNKDYIPRIEAHNPGCEVIHLDQDTDWNLNRRFDLIIHTGVLYHLVRWERDLQCALKHSDTIVLESEVANSDNPQVNTIGPEHGYDQSIHGFGSNISASCIEQRLTRFGCSYTRYDDRDLSTLFHRYDWEVDIEHGYRINGLRRFWIVRKNV